MKKKSYIGWIADLSVVYDRDTGRVIKDIRRKDETLRYFEYGPDVTPDRIVLHIPLITPKKRFWLDARRKSFKVKVTIEKL